MKYRPEIDGLRAIAVVPVLLFHAGVSFLPAGYLGVDIFFVISGYLITSILLKDLNAGDYSLLDFYERRARRILPALFLVIAVSFPFAVWLMPGTTFDIFLGGARSAVLFIANFHYWSVVDYFLPGAEMQPLVHTWSLAVEEQFYVIFPLLLFLVYAIGGRERWLLFLTLLGCLASLALARWAESNAPLAMFYLTPTRAWELGAGAIAALFLHYPDRLINFEKAVGARIAGALSIAGLTLIVLAMVLYNQFTPIPSFPALTPIIGCVMVILFTRENSLTWRLLSFRLLVGIGLISYSLYLWHQPVFVFYRYWQMAEIAFLSGALLIAVTVALAYLSWRFVEQPFRSRSRFNRRAVFAAASAGIIGFTIITSVGLSMRWSEVRTMRVDVGQFEADKYALARQSYEWLQRDSGDPNYQFRTRNRNTDQLGWFDLDDPRERLMIVGNSHSTDCYNMVVASNDAMERFQASRYRENVFSLLSNEHPFFASEAYESSEWVMICTRMVESETAIVSEKLAEVVDRFREDGKRVIIVENVFNFVDHHDFSLADRFVLLNKSKLGDEYTIADLADDLNAAHFAAWKAERGERLDLLDANREIRVIADQLGVPVLSRMPLLCDESEQTCHAVASDLTRHLWDYGHYTLAGARFFAKRADEVGWFDQIPE